MERKKREETGKYQKIFQKYLKVSQKYPKSNKQVFK